MSDSSRLEEARAIALRLGEETDRLTASLVRIEEALKRLGLGIPASIECGAFTVSYQKYGADWGLFIHEGDGRPVRVTQSSRTRRVVAAGLVGPLVERLIANAKQMRIDVDFANEIVDGVLATLGASDV